MSEPTYDRDAWHRVTIDMEAAMLASGVSYLACEVSGVRYCAPLGSQPPARGIRVETVYASEAEPS